MSAKIAKSILAAFTARQRGTSEEAGWSSERFLGRGYARRWAFKFVGGFFQTGAENLFSGGAW